MPGGKGKTAAAAAAAAPPAAAVAAAGNEDEMYVKLDLGYTLVCDDVDAAAAASDAAAAAPPMTLMAYVQFRPSSELVTARGASPQQWMTPAHEREPFSADDLAEWQTIPTGLPDAVVPAVVAALDALRAPEALDALSTDDDELYELYDDVGADDDDADDAPTPSSVVRVPAGTVRLLYEYVPDGGVPAVEPIALDPASALGRAIDALLAVPHMAYR